MWYSQTYKVAPFSSCEKKKKDEIHTDKQIERRKDKQQRWQWRRKEKEREGETITPSFCVTFPNKRNGQLVSLFSLFLSFRLSTLVFTFSLQLCSLHTEHKCNIACLCFSLSLPFSPPSRSSWCMHYILFFSVPYLSLLWA